MNTTSKHYLSLNESLSDAGAALIARDLHNEYETGKINRDEYLHLKMEKRITQDRRDIKARTAKFCAVQFERVPDEGLL